MFLNHIDRSILGEAACPSCRTLSVESHAAPPRRQKPSFCMRHFSLNSMLERSLQFSFLHLHIAVHLHPFGRRDPQYVVTPERCQSAISNMSILCNAFLDHAINSLGAEYGIPYQNLSQGPRTFAVDEFLRAIQLDVHVRVHADQLTFVFCLTPLQSNYDFFVDPGKTKSFVSAVAIDVVCR